MRRMLTAGLLALVLVVAVTACEPAPTVKITIKAEPAKPICGATGRLSGTVTPAKATPKVVLQRAKDGKWEDWIWLQGTGSAEGSHRIYGTVDASGKWSFQYLVPYSRKTLHLRVRSLGGGVASPGVYLTPKSDIPEMPCPS